MQNKYCKNDKQQQQKMQTLKPIFQREREKYSPIIISCAIIYILANAKLVYMILIINIHTKKTRLTSSKYCRIIKTTLALKTKNKKNINRSVTAHIFFFINLFTVFSFFSFYDPKAKACFIKIFFFLKNKQTKSCLLRNTVTAFKKKNGLEHHTCTKKNKKNSLFNTNYKKRICGEN